MIKMVKDKISFKSCTDHWRFLIRLNDDGQYDKGIDSTLLFGESKEILGLKEVSYWNE